MSNSILVVGGAGYIGSHMTKLLNKEGYCPVILDDLSQGRRSAVAGQALHVFDFGDKAALDRLFRNNMFAAVIHFAGSIQVGESLAHPGRYYDNNVAKTISLLQTMIEHKVLRIIFSSSAAVFGNPKFTPIDESHPKSPINPYGKSKWMIEQILEDFGAAYDLKSVSLRYFNAAGADPDGEIGESHEPETHLIPLVLQVASGLRTSITIHGSDYDTPDGTCIRDYVHVQDLCTAHLLALRSLLHGGTGGCYNLGNGNGYSVSDVINTAEVITGRTIPRLFGPRRIGDPAILVADSELARAELGWTPRFSDLHVIIRDAWKWEQKRSLNSLPDSA